MGKPGPKPIPTAIKKLKGGRAVYHRPEKPDDPSTVLYHRRPPAPKHLDKVAAAEWRRMVELLYSAKQITKLDQSCLELYCTAYSVWRKASDELQKHGLLVKAPSGYPIQSPYLPIVNKQQGILVKLLAEIGGTPSSRSRLPGSKEPEKDDFQEFLKHGAKPYEVA